MTQEQLESMLAEMKVELATMRAEFKAAWKRIDEQRELAESVHTLALSARDMAAEIKQLRADYEAMRHDVEELKARPNKRWESVVGAGITGLVGAALAWLIKS